MSAQISFDTSERRLADKNAIKLNTAQVESNILGSEGSSKKATDTDKAQGSATVEPKTFPVESQTRKVDYYIEQGSNEVVIKIRDWRVWGSYSANSSRGVSPANKSDL